MLQLQGKWVLITGASRGLPGIIVGAFVNDGKSGRIFSAQDFAGLTLEQAVQKAETMQGSY